MKITVLQRDIVWGDAKLNLQRADEAIRALPDADVYVLPEMFPTGFCTRPEGVADSNHAALGWMRRMAVERSAAVVGSIATEEGGRYYNRLYFVHPDGREEHYDKRHLFTYGGEDKHYTAGEERVVVDYRGVRILLQVCYDLRFPVWSRNRRIGGKSSAVDGAGYDYDIIIYVASWPTSRIAVWNTLLAARAIENQCYVVGVNRVGSDPACDYCGASCIISPYGKTIARCEDNVETTATADIDMEALNAFRRKFPVLEDMDEFTI